MTRRNEGRGVPGTHGDPLSPWRSAALVEQVLILRGGLELELAEPGMQPAESGRHPVGADCLAWRCIIRR